jgi:hypothetical protein
MNKANRYIVSVHLHIHAQNDQEAIKLAQEARKDIETRYSTFAHELCEQKFGTLDSRRVDQALVEAYTDNND